MSLLVVVESEMNRSFYFGFFFAVIEIISTMPLFAIENHEQIDIIERQEHKKKISVKNLTEGSEGLLKNYRTFSFYLKGNLIFCHISKDGTDPKVICH